MQVDFMKTGRFFKCLFQQFFNDQCPARAAGLAYTTLLSIVPLMLFTFYVLSFVPTLQVAGMQMEQFILHNFVASSASVISKQLQVFVAHIKILSWTNIIALAVISVLLIYNMVGAVNQVWRVKLRLSLALSFFVYLVFILLAPILFGLLLLLTSYLTSFPLLSKTAHFLYFKRWVFLLFPFLIEWLVFSLFNWLLPSTKVGLKPALIAGLITMLLFEMAKICFVQYLHYFPTYRLLYGALATIPIFLVWIYVSWILILLGVTICYLLQTKPYQHQKP